MLFTHPFLYSAALVALASGALSSTILAHRRHALFERADLFTRSAHDLYQRDDCEPAGPLNTLTDRLNILLNTSGPGYTLPLCPSTQYIIEAPILFFAPNQEISTVGYPTGDDRATLVVNGPVENGSGHTTAVDGTCGNCNGVKLRNIQINGTRLGAPPTSGGANIEMGGSNSDQLIEYVHSFDPRSWSCLHVAEGAFTCNNVTVQNNDIGPCGSDAYQEWADGISVSCLNAVVRNNMVNNPTDGGIVIFGSPGTLVENNTIWVETHTLLGGINLVDEDPWNANFTNTIVRNNYIEGGFANEKGTPGQADGVNDDDVIIKIGIAIGPRTWFGPFFGNNVSFSGTVINNSFTGAFGYAIAMSSARNFTVENNTLWDQTAFIGSRGPNCSASDTTPNSTAFVVDWSTTTDTTAQPDFESIPDGNSLTCVVPPDGGDFWPFGGNPADTADPPIDPFASAGPSPSSSPDSTPHSTGTSSASGGLSAGGKAGLAVGIIVGVLVIAVAAWFVRKWALRRAAASKSDEPWRRSGYVEGKEA